MDEKVLTEFNSNAATLQRVDNLLRLSSSAAINSDYNHWYLYLKEIRKEAIVKMKAEERKEAITIFTKLDGTMELYRKAKVQNMVLRKKVERDLEDADIFVRQFMNDVGMLLRDGDSAKNALQRG